jgi:adenylylsulfate kinase-like enzyme
MTKVKNWVYNDSSRSGIFWLYGGAGAGKSALAQTVAQEFKESGRLAASFFSVDFQARGATAII